VGLLFRFETPSQQYRAGACAVSCFDARFELVVRKFLKRSGAEPVDHIRIAGGPRTLSSPADAAHRDFLLDQIRASIRLHATDRVILLAHSDCGACGGLEAFQGDTVRERAWHEAELSRAAGAVRATFPELALETCFADFAGVWRVSQHVSAN
jgi:hypothetical protein